MNKATKSNGVPRSRVAEILFELLDSDYFEDEESDE